MDSRKERSGGEDFGSFPMVFYLSSKTIRKKEC